MQNVLCALFFLGYSFAFGGNLADTIKNTQVELINQQISGNHWSGVYTLDASVDALTLALGHKLKLINSELSEEIINSILLRIHPSQVGWSSYPGGDVDLDITAITLFSLELAGIAKSDLRVKKSWDWYTLQNPHKRLGPYAKIHLIPLGLFPDSFILDIPIYATVLPIEKLGVFKGAIYPALVWSHFNTHRGLEGDALDRALQKILASENPTGGWYTINFTFLSVLALHEAQKNGYADFSSNISRAWTKILSWRAVNFEGQSVQKALLTDVWDTAGVVNAIHSVPVDLRTNIDLLASANWLVDKGIHKNNGHAMAWSFDSGDKSYPDTDDTAAVLHALSKVENKTQEINLAVKKSISWILSLQNADGGFPAWDRGISKLPFIALRMLFKNFPEAEDISQSDVTARVILALKSAPPSLETQSAIDRACKFLVTTGRKIKDIPFKIAPGHWVTNYFYSAAMDLAGLAKAECEFKRQRSLADWLVSKQNLDGGWGEDNSGYTKKQLVVAPSTLLQTSLVLAGLIEYNKRLRSQDIEDKYNWTQDSIQRGIEFIIRRSQGGTNYFEKEFTAVVVKGKLFNRYELVPFYSSLYVLSEWYKITVLKDK